LSGKIFETPDLTEGAGKRLSSGAAEATCCGDIRTGKKSHRTAVKSKKRELKRDKRETIPYVRGNRGP